MAGAGCSGTQPFKTLLNHHDHDRGLASNLTTKPNFTPNVRLSARAGPRNIDGTTIRSVANSSQTFRGPNTSSPDHGRFKSFISSDHLPTTPIATLTAAPTLAGNVAGTIPGGPPSFSTLQYPTPRQIDDRGRQEVWAQEFLRQSSRSPANAAIRPDYKPSLTPANNRPIQGFQPGLVNGTYHNLQPPYMGRSDHLAEPGLVSQTGHAAEVTEWIGAHRPSGVALEDVDRVLSQISGELEELDVEAAPENELPSTVMQGERRTPPDPTEFGSADTESELSRRRAGQTTTVSHLASKILQAVDHEDGEKWKDSSFLELMRDFRDGRKDVAGDTIEVVMS